MNWLRDEKRSEGPSGVITFGVSVGMTAGLKQHIVRLPESAWKPYRRDGEMESECIDVLNYWPEDEDRPEDVGLLRYVAIRIRKR